MILTMFIISGCYAALIIFLLIGFNKLEAADSHFQEPEADFSIIIPFRNEENNLPGLFNSISHLNYPPEKFEIILINDASSDGSKALCKTFKKQHPNFNISILENSEETKSPKKEAIKLGIQSSSKEWIVTTDADCLCPENWLKSFDQMIKQKHLKMLVAPVSYIPESGLLNRFQCLDFLSLQGTTIGLFGQENFKFNKPFLCNGANLCYAKDAFYEVNGFQGNEHVASGDDVFLLEKFYSKYPQGVGFVKTKEALVKTHAKNTLKGLLYQRIRWASKTTAYEHYFGKAIGLLVFLTNLSLIIAAIMAFLGSMSFLHFGFLYLLKFNVDFVLLFKTTDFFDQKEQMKAYFVSSLIHPLFIVLVVLLSFKKKYTWKDRVF